MRRKKRKKKSTTEKKGRKRRNCKSQAVVRHSLSLTTRRIH
jgi:hypothetical protein